MDKKRKILIVDDNVTNLNIARKALCDEYHVVLIKSGEMAIAELAKIKPDLILLDVEMPGLNGFDVIKKIKNEMGEPYKSIPVVFLTAKDDGTSEYEGLNLGAVDYVIKPFSAVLLKKRVQLHLDHYDYSTNLENLVKDKTSRIEELQYAIVYAMSEVVERRDHNTGGHILRTSLYMRALLEQARADSIYEGELNEINTEVYSYASQMHDVGKICVPDHVLLKPGKLTDEEYETMKKHTTYGGEIIKSAMSKAREADFLEAADILASTHHEKWNGKGYPFGLSGQNIPIGGRVLAIVDAYDAITSKRPYKDAKEHAFAVDIITKDSGSHFDPELVKSFLAIEKQFAIIAEENRDL